jgi:hypothetical protein
MTLDTETIERAPQRRRVDLRRSPRHSVRLRALLHRANRFQTTIIHDLSVHGARVDGAMGVYPGDVVEIWLMGGRKIAGRVAWWLMGSCGIEFSEPLTDDDPLLTVAAL